MVAKELCEQYHRAFRYCPCGWIEGDDEDDE